MSDHLIAEANRHAAALPGDLSTVKSSVLAEDIIKALSDIAWYVRECETLRTENATLRADKERLDWIARNRSVSATERPLSVTPESLRASIDAARKEAQP